MMSLPWSSKREKDMFKTIVLALDGSDGAKQAIPVAAELAEKEKAKIVIAHVTEYMAAKGGELPHVDEDQVRAEIDEEAKKLSDRGIETKVELAEVSSGRPGACDRRDRRPQRRRSDRHRHPRPRLDRRPDARKRRAPASPYRQATDPCSSLLRPVDRRAQSDRNQRSLERDF